MSNRDEGLEQKLRRLLDDLRNFKIANPEAQQQMQNMLERLNMLRERNVGAAEQALTRAGKSLEQKRRTSTRIGCFQGRAGENLARAATRRQGTVGFSGRWQREQRAISIPSRWQREQRAISIPGRGQREQRAISIPGRGQRCSEGGTCRRVQGSGRGGKSPAG